MPFDRAKFNADPKHAEEREQFDAMLEDSTARIIARKAREKNVPAPTTSLFDSFFAAPGEPNIFDKLFGGK